MLIVIDNSAFDAYTFKINTNDAMFVYIQSSLGTIKFQFITNKQYYSFNLKLQIQK